MLRQQLMASGPAMGLLGRLTAYSVRFPRRAVIGLILVVSLFAFEVFNFDTTRYALLNLLGPVSLAGLGWATILAVAFCAIDFAGLVRLFTADEAGEQPREAWYLMGAWLLGATMNALMTWWAVSLTLLNHDFGNEVLSRSQLLTIVPIFVAVLVWLTRILFIGALSVAGGHVLAFGRKSSPAPRREAKIEQNARKPVVRSHRAAPPQRRAIKPIPKRTQKKSVPHVSDALPGFLEGGHAEQSGSHGELASPASSPASGPEARSRRPTNGRVRRRPPLPSQKPSSIRAKSLGQPRRAA